MDADDELAISDSAFIVRIYLELKTEGAAPALNIFLNIF